MLTKVFIIIIGILIIIFFVAIGNYFIVETGFAGSVVDMEIYTPLKGKNVEFTDDTLYEVGDSLNFESHDGTIWTSDIVPNFMLAVGR